MTNRSKNFQYFNFQFSSSILETGLPDFHRMILTVFTSKLPHKQPKVISTTIHALIKKLEKEIANTISTQKILSKDFEAFTAIVTDSLNKHAPLKKAKYLRASHSEI